MAQPPYSAAFAGSTLVSRLNTHTLHRAVGALLGGLAIVMAAHGLMAQAGAALSAGGPMLFALGAVSGIAIGLLGSMLGVAGGELLIPTLVLLYGLDIKSAGTVSLAVSLPMLIVTPLPFLGGAFYSVDMLPQPWRTVTLFNPVVYLISGFRWSFYGKADVDVTLSLGITIGPLARWIRDGDNELAEMVRNHMERINSLLVANRVD